MTSIPRVLHLAGADSSAFYHDLSLVYAEEAFLPASMTHTFAVVEPDAGWRVGPSLAELGPPMTLSRFLAELGPVDLVVPYMFDQRGMTSYRSFFEDIVGVPVVGSRAEVTTLATDKAMTKLIVAAAGVPVPRSHDPAGDDVTFPVIVKPNREDNSRGLSLVRSAAELPAAVERAAAFDAGVVVEQYLGGRELRLAVVDQGDELYVPAMIEYAVSEDHPVRELAHKLDVDADGNPVSQTTSPAVAPVCPAPVTPDLRTQLVELAIQAHQALGCRHYSLFDVRLDPDSGRPHLLEAGLFWTFGRPSMITKMIAADGRDPEVVAERVWRSAMCGERRNGRVAGFAQSAIG
ncbi:MAG: D-alanine--D-alanine ligase [Actinomycetota bacterium]